MPNAKPDKPLSDAEVAYLQSVANLINHGLACPADVPDSLVRVATYFYFEMLPKVTRAGFRPEVVAMGYALAIMEQAAAIVSKRSGGVPDDLTEAIRTLRGQLADLGAVQPLPTFDPGSKP